jgi:YggT family protein
LSALVFIVRTLFDLYLLTFAVRLLLQRGRIDTWNPLTQFILRVTGPLVLPLRRVLPPVGRLDTATLAALFLLQLLATGILLRLGCAGGVGPVNIVLGALLALADLFLRVWFWTLLIHVVLSWVGQGGRGNPGAALVASIAEPLLQPIRRVIPPIAGLDLSPLFAILALQAARMLLPVELAVRGLACGGMALPVV